jgi:hypothetical protein
MPSRDLSEAWCVLEQLGIARDDRYGPVLLGRELLIQAFGLVDSDDGTENAAVAVKTAALTFLWGVIDPSPAEYASGVDFGRCDALMWFGIATALLVPIDGVVDADTFPERPSILRGQSDPRALATASTIFESLGDFVKAGRCSEELGELCKIDSPNEADNSHFDRASKMFKRGGRPERSRIAEARATASDRPSSPFFHRQIGSEQSTTIIGSREFEMLRTTFRNFTL